MARRYATRVDVAGEAGTPGGVARELNGVPDTAFATWLDYAAQHIGVGRWRTSASQGHALLTAHCITIVTGEDGSPAPEAGPLMSEANGPASRSFATPTLSDDELGTTTYGRLYLGLRNRIRGRGVGVIARSGIRRVE